MKRGDSKGERVARVGRISVKADLERIWASLHLDDTSRCVPVCGSCNRVDDFSSYHKQKNHTHYQEQQLQRFSHLHSLSSESIDSPMFRPKMVPRYVPPNPRTNEAR